MERKKVELTSKLQLRFYNKINESNLKILVLGLFINLLIAQLVQRLGKVYFQLVRFQLIIRNSKRCLFNDSNDKQVSFIYLTEFFLFCLHPWCSCLQSSDQKMKVKHKNYSTFLFYFHSSNMNKLFIAFGKDFFQFCTMRKKEREIYKLYSRTVFSTFQLTLYGLTLFYYEI